MKRSIGTVLPILLVALSPVAAAAQQNQAASFASAPALSTPAALDLQQEQEQESEKDIMSKSGMFLGIVGMLAGATIGSGVSASRCDKESENCTSHHAFTGALIAGSAMVPIGVHIANKRPKNLLMSFGASAMTGTVLYFAMKAIPGEPVQIAPFLAAPVQMVTSIKIETRK